MRIHVRTSRRNKSIFDCYTNMLRATTEALSAVIGGCDQLTVEAFGFEEHLAANVSRILSEEAHLNVTADPAGGAYLVEVLTDSIARDAWKVFQGVEAAGGYGAALKSGAIEQALAKSRAEREKAIALRRRTLVGVNNYPNLAEKSPAIDAAPSGLRLAEPFERIRCATEHYARVAGRTPKVLLLTRGDRKMRMARANFSLNFFGCAGFAVEEATDFEGKQADMIVLCSSDPEYLDLAREVCPRVKVPVLVAGNPKDQIDALTAAGIQGFIHLQSDAVQTLMEWQKRLGIA
jgi:methylmalonyl-CoA mutase